MRRSIAMLVGVFSGFLFLVSPALAQKTGCASDSVQVGPVCVDKYEASVWSKSAGGTQVLGEYPCLDTGNDCKGKIFARSVKGVTPATSITWFQAQMACMNSGKRLLTNAEWQGAAAGTPDGSPCRVTGGNKGSTGSIPACVSAWGAFDMVGNYWEWVADWVPRSPSPSDCASDTFEGWGDCSRWSRDGIVWKWSDCP